MAIESILAQIDEEIAKLEQIRSLLANTSVAAKAVKAPRAKKASAKEKGKKRRTLSPEARNRIADAQRKRWAKQRGKSK
ncbi:MAG TPA: hypothetical protein VI320_33555 [Terracidiphilus sp.]|jgi:hypothetical protein